MDLAAKMATFPRHGHLVMSLFPNILELFKEKKVYPLQEENILVFFGKKYSLEETLVDVSNLHDVEHFREKVIDTLAFVQPDFLFFQENKFVQSNNTLKTAGVPDLIVEVWSDSNDQYEREFKFRLYSSNQNCEHWYLEQESNRVEKFLGTQKQATQTLNEILVTTKGIKFDLRYLALPDNV